MTKETAALKGAIDDLETELDMFEDRVSEELAGLADRQNGLSIGFGTGILVASVGAIFLGVVAFTGPSTNDVKELQGRVENLSHLVTLAPVSSWYCEKSHREVTSTTYNDQGQKTGETTAEICDKVARR